MRLILRECGQGDARLFRNNVALAWVGERVRHEPDLLVLRNPRPLHAGLCVGSSDLIGWRTVTITPEMVGQRVAVFTAIESKSLRGRAKEEQENFIGAVRRAGGIAGIARTVEEAQKILTGIIENE